MFSFRKNKKGKVFVGLSGGVDSAVSAALLAREGYEVTGVFIRIQIPGYPCPAALDRIEAMRVAAHLKIPFIEIDLSDEYSKRVFAASMEEFAKGHTPNPDALCNREIKFGVFYDFAMAHGADFVATGHYARIAAQNHSVALLAGLDQNKDQSYFLWAVPQSHLARTLFPVGGMHKPQVRSLAKKFRLPNNARPDSQGLCFLGDLSLDDMLAREIAPAPGNILSEDGEVVGTHKGVAFYTLGQRHGFTLSVSDAQEVPHYVIAKDQAHNTITISKNRFPKNATRTDLLLSDCNWIGDVKDGNYMARYRYRQTLIPATLKTDGEKKIVTLHEPHYAPLGQSLVLYTGERCMGGGIITSAWLS